MALWWLPAAAQAGGSLLNYFTRRKAPKFDNTSYGRELGRTAREGKYSPTARNNIVGRVGATAGQAAQEQKADTRGYLEARGMGNSIAGAKALSAPDTARMRTVSNAATDIETENEISKTRAREEYARARMRYDMGAREEENAAKGELIGGLAGAGMTAVSGYGEYALERKRVKELDNIKRLMDSGEVDEDELINQLMLFKQQYGGR